MRQSKVQFSKRVNEKIAKGVLMSTILRRRTRFNRAQKCAEERQVDRQLSEIKAQIKERKRKEVVRLAKIHVHFPSKDKDVYDTLLALFGRCGFDRGRGRARTQGMATISEKESSSAE
jgi:hypothetical protein